MPNRNRLRASYTQTSKVKAALEMIIEKGEPQWLYPMELSIGNF